FLHSSWPGPGLSRPSTPLTCRAVSIVDAPAQGPAADLIRWPGITSWSSDAGCDPRRRASRTLSCLFVEAAPLRDAGPRGRAEPCGRDVRVRRGVLRSRARVPEG